jgi:hypothetical protein
MPIRHRGAALFGSLLAAGCGGGDGELDVMTEAVPVLVSVEGGTSFGVFNEPCRRADREVCLRNTSDKPVHIDHIGLAEDDPSPDFVLTRDDAELTLEPGERDCFSIAYAPDEPAADRATLSVVFSDPPATMRLDLDGSADYPRRQFEKYRQSGNTRVDFLFVIDKTPAMRVWESTVFDQLDSMFRTIDRFLDYHVAVISTDQREDGVFYPLHGRLPRVVDRTLANPFAVFHDNVRVGISDSETSKGLEMVHRAMQHRFDPATNDGFFRDDAFLAIVFVTPQNDDSEGAVSLYADYFREVHGAHADYPALAFGFLPVGEGKRCIVTARSFEEGTRYLELIDDLGGFAHSICEDDWASLLAFFPVGPPSTLFKLKTGADPSSIRVTVMDDQGTVSPSLPWRYDQDLGAILFEDVNQAPPFGALVDISYVSDCR